MKRNSWNFGSGILVLLVVLHVGCNRIAPEEVQEFGKVKVGEMVPGFSAVSEGSGREFTMISPSAEFFVHFVSDRLPPMCLNEDCGPMHRIVTEKGGNLIGCSDGKCAGQFGVEILNLKERQYKTSLMVGTDSTGMILSIFPGAKEEDLEYVVEDLLKKLKNREMEYISCMYLNLH